MADSSAGGDGFFSYYRQYARSGIHGASAAALTALGLWASFTGNRWFILLAIAVYVLPPILLYLTGEGENVPSVVGTDADEHEPDRSDREDGETGRHGSDSATSDFEADSVGSTGETDRESNATSGESATRTAGSATDDAAATAVGGSTERSETNGSTPDADVAPSKTEPAGERDASSQRDTDEESSSAGRDSTADDTAATGGAESAVEEVDADEHNGPAESVVEDSGADKGAAEPGWTETDAPTDQSLLAAVATHDGAYAVGETGVVLVRDEGGWEVALDDGPMANANTLRGVDATDDGEAVWFAGDSGVLGRYADGRLTDHSAPEDQTSTWEDIAVTGKAGDERVHLVNGSGELLRGTYENGRVSWGDIEKPGSGSSIAAIAFATDDRGHLVDTNQSVYETTDGGESYERIGIEDANAAFTAVAASDSTVLVTADDGSLFRHDGAVWTRLQPGEGALSAVVLANGTGLAAGDGGAVYELTEGSWEPVETPIDADLHGIAIASERADVAVGTDGTVIERRR